MKRYPATVLVLTVTLRTPVTGLLVMMTLLLLGIHF